MEPKGPCSASSLLAVSRSFSIGALIPQRTAIQDATVFPTTNKKMIPSRRSLRRAATHEYFGGSVKQATVRKEPNPIDRHVGSRVRLRRMILGMSQSKLADGLGLTFQQVQKYEKGANRMGASRLQHISHILQVPVLFFFEGAPQLTGQSKGNGEAAAPTYASEFLATSDGIALTKAFMRIKDISLRRRIVELVEEMAGDDSN
jgi:transcriptional regulator with XRE-family HTH domain